MKGDDEDELSTRRKEYSDYVEQHIGVSAYLCKQERRTQISTNNKRMMMAFFHLVEEEGYDDGIYNIITALL